MDSENLKTDYDLVKKKLEKEYSDANEFPLSKFNKTAKEKVLWYCAACDEDYPAQIRKRVYENSGCPRCAKKRSDVPLSQEFPHLVKDFDTNKNKKHLDYYSPGSTEKVWWKCHVCGDERELPINSRASKGYGCKICTTNIEMKRRVKRKIEKEGSLLSRAPHIAAQWDYKKNEKRPEDYAWKSGAEVFWECDYGHSWKTTIHSRVKANAGCRKCGNQNSQYEMRLFSELKLFDPDIKWNSRIGGLECDIFLPSIAFAIEVDGYPWHDSDASRERDKIKTKELEKEGIITLRYRDSQLKNLTKEDIFYKHEGDQFPSFIELLKLIKKKVTGAILKEKLQNYIDSQTEFINEVDFQELYKRSGKIIHRKSLQDEFPEVAKYWSSKNHPLTPNDVYSRGKKVVWWDCHKCNGDYELMVKERTRGIGDSNGCPCGSTKSVNDKNNLLATRGKSVETFWDFQKNDSKPEDYRPNSRTVVWWVCPDGDSFKEQIVKLWGDKRNKNIRCRKCKKLFLIKTYR